MHMGPTGLRNPTRAAEDGRAWCEGCLGMHMYKMKPSDVLARYLVAHAAAGRAGPADGDEAQEGPCHGECTGCNLHALAWLVERNGLAMSLPRPPHSPATTSPAAFGSAPPWLTPMRGRRSDNWCSLRPASVQIKTAAKRLLMSADTLGNMALDGGARLRSAAIRTRNLFMRQSPF